MADYEINDENNQNLSKIATCPNCKSNRTLHCDTDEIDFMADGTGRFYEDRLCITCLKRFMVYHHFNFEITHSSCSD